MRYTQVELTSERNLKEIWWLPVPSGKAKVGEIITRTLFDPACAPTELDPFYEEDWTITMIGTTLKQEDIPAKSRVATNFKRESHTHYHMEI
jgi:hypothetical protein